MPESGLETLIVNCGSSSLKFAWLDAVDGAVRAKGLADRLGTAGARIKFERGLEAVEESIPDLDHGRALRRLAELCWGEGGPPAGLCAVGHRVVHGGDAFRAPLVVDEEALRGIEACADLAPLHTPANVLGMRIAREMFPDLPHVAVFDTAFHQTMPPRAYLYAVPYAWYEQHRARRYGFHGTSHQFVSGEAARMLGLPADDCQLIVAHLGNGCSVCAVRDGRSVDTSMGLTPLEGLVMGTRSGDVDPNLLEYIARATGLPLHEVVDVLNRGGGLLGLSGLSNDMRTLVAAAAAGHARAGLAIDVFCYRLARWTLGMAAGLTRIDALVFTGGIGENSAEVRARTLAHLAVLRPELDPDRNAAHGRGAQGTITREGAPGLKAMVVPTNEEWAIGRIAAEFRRIA